MKIIISAICRAVLPNAVLALVDRAGIIPIPSDLMDPRQIKVIPSMGEDFPARVKYHRGQMITTITLVTADELVDQHKAEYLPQSLLVYSRENYLDASQVTGDEFDRVTESDAELVVVAVIGDNRSPLAVVRNMAEMNTEGIGLGDLQEMKEQAADALEAVNVVLIED